MEALTWPPGYGNCDVGILKISCSTDPNHKQYKVLFAVLHKLYGMKKNMGSLDKTIRLTLAAIFIITWLANIITGVTAVVLVIVAVVFIVTSLIGFCPLYKLLGITTCTRQQV